MKSCAKLAAFVTAAMILGSCAREITPVAQQPDNDIPVQNAGLDSGTLVAGRVVVKVSEELSSILESCTAADGCVRLPSVKAMNSATASMGIVGMRRLFPDAGEFEPRTRAEGLHRWYVLDYDENVAVTRSSGALQAVPGIELIEYQPKIHIDAQLVDDQPSMAPTASSTSLPFNDPRLADQWHYFNNGTASGSQSGCDVNVVPVWENYTTGNPDVIVSVVDGGVDFQHEDLADNMWHNPAQHGTGQYGFNFISGNYAITPESHGTHVAGTIAAVNNNGIGVCGIAGGNKARGVSGVKIMSCQIFDDKDGNGSGPEAIKWGADHGAVISQNSWGYIDIESTPGSLKAAVDYFIKYAGFDASGNQTGPMAGGIVFFAAGNENRNMDYTACYEPAVAVTSVGADYRRAYYSNYGEWADIAAPGGDAKKGNQILSTLPGNKYGRMQGTSMACPHVSGVAALIVSRFGGKGFTSQALRMRLEQNVTDISSYNRSYPMGAGLVNAYKCMVTGGGTAPGKVTGFSATASSNNVDFSLVVPSDADDGKPYTINVYYSTTSIRNLSDAMFGTFYVGSVKAGEKLSGRLTDLEFDKKYFLTAVAVDMAGNASSQCTQISVTTGSNNAPVITSSGPQEVVLHCHEYAVFPFSIKEPDGHFCQIELIKGSDQEKLDTIVRMQPKINVMASLIDPGEYVSTLVVRDYYGLEATASVRYKVLENHAPVKVGELQDQIFSEKGKMLQLTTSDYFMDEDGEALNYTVENSNPDVVSVNESEGVIYIVSIGFGRADITMTGKDVKGLSVTQSFRVLVRDGDSPLDVYPNPVSDRLNIRTGEKCKARVEIVNTYGATVMECELESSPFDPASIDVSKLPAGVYTVCVSYDGRSEKKKIVKI